QIGSAVAELDQSTQQNAALVEQMAAAAHTLNQQTRGLVESVAVFRVDTRFQLTHAHAAPALLGA
ncbi:MAG: methyl-accepting chemotaxis protein, partial [Comamonadaceae bacterium]